MNKYTKFTPVLIIHKYLEFCPDLTTDKYLAKIITIYL